MTTTYSPLNLRPALWFGALLLGLLALEHLATTAGRFATEPLLPYAVTFDLVVGVPALYYALVVRRYGLPLLSVAGAVGAGLALAHWLLPPAQQAPVQLLRYLPLLLEGAVLLTLLAKGRHLLRAYRTAYRRLPHRWPSLRLAARHTLGPAGALLVAEADMLGYALLGWRTRPAPVAGATAYSTYRESGFTAFAVMIGVALLVEAGVAHLLLGLWSPRAANWLLLFDGYTLLMLAAHGQAVRLQPVLLTARTLRLRVGFVWQLRVPLSQVVAVVPLRYTPEPALGLLDLTKLLFSPPNVLLTFAHPVTVRGPYGLRRTARQLAIYLDQPREFMTAIEAGRAA